jgi:hypothetical protein
MGVQLQKIERVHFALIAGAVTLAGLTGWMGAGSVALGGGVMAANLWLLKRISRRLLTPGMATQRPGVVLLLVLAKFSIFLGLLGLLFWRVPLDPMAFAAGATLLMVACVVVALASPGPSVIEVEGNG